MTLALLITAVTGAWAQTETLLTTITASSDFTSGSKTFDNKATVTFSGTVNYDSDDGWNFYDMEADPVTMTITAAEGYTITSVKLTIGDERLTDTEAPFVATLYGQSYYPKTTISDQASGIWGGVNKIEVYGYETPSSGPEVTITGTSTEGQQAEFDMPQNDVTVTYTLKRDLSVETQVTVGDGTDGVRYRVQKQGNTFQPVGMDQAQVMALFRVHDQIEDQDLAPVQDYTVQIYAVDIEGQPTGDAITFQNFTYAPGQYIVKAVAKDGSNYVGQTTESNVFTLYQGYELTVAPGDFATYYREDDALYVEDEDVKLYTITAVSGQTATAEPISVAPAGTPVLVKNNSADPEKTTILLIPTTDQQPDAVTPYAGFVGTLEATTIAASDAATDRYALNGQQFVWVKNPVSIAANKAWLEVSTGDNARARAINIVFGEATGVSAIDNGQLTIDNWYDLNGRKVTVPNKKGIYIMNGKKVVVK